MMHMGDDFSRRLPLQQVEKFNDNPVRMTLADKITSGTATDAEIKEYMNEGIQFMNNWYVEYKIDGNPVKLKDLLQKLKNT